MGPIRSLLAAAPIVAALVATAGAQDYPSRPVTFVIPFAAGGGSDVLARIIAEPLSRRLGQPVIVDNKPGGGATIGADFVAKSQPDGYTWLYTSPGPQIINPFLMAKLPYDPDRDLVPVVRLGTFTSVLAVHPSVPATSVAELIAHAKANPKKLNYASAGIGSGSHLASEYFRTVAGIEIVHVPYKGTGNALLDLIAGNVQMTIDSMAALLPAIKAGQLRALAVTTVDRSPVLPDVPTLADTLAGFDASPMNYLSVRGGTPRQVIDRINREVNAVLASPAVRERMLAIGVVATPSTPDEIAQQVKSEQVKWKKVIEMSGAKAE